MWAPKRPADGDAVLFEQVGLGGLLIGLELLAVR